MKLGESRTVKILNKTSWTTSGGSGGSHGDGGDGGSGGVEHTSYAEAYFSITRKKLNVANDDGYYTYTAWITGPNSDSVRTWPRVRKWTGKSSPHFGTDNISLTWMKSRTLL